MKINPTTGLLENAQFIASPNFNNRPNDNDISLLVIHNISLPPNQFGGPYISQLFCNQLNPDDHPFFREINNLRVSSHLLIRRNGDTIQYVPFHKKAWHAGVSEFNKQTSCNDFSIGIELEGTDSDAYEEAQYQKLAQITRHLIAAYPKILIDNIVGHCDIAPDRKTDPGEAFDWPKYRQLISCLSSS